MKVSELTLDVLKEYLRLDEVEEAEQGLLETIKVAAVQYASSYTGLLREELDKYEDITIAVMALISDMYDNRVVSTPGKYSSTNRIVESILAMHSVNLL